MLADGGVVAVCDTDVAAFGGSLNVVDSGGSVELFGCGAGVVVVGVFVVGCGFVAVGNVIVTVAVVVAVSLAAKVIGCLPVVIIVVSGFSVNNVLSVDEAVPV